MAHARADNRYTRGLAEFVSGLRYERIPDEVRARLKLLMLDSLGCALFGAGLEWSRILRRTLAAVDTSRGATLWGTDERLSAPHAALVNGTAVQGFELDDVHRQGVLHVGAVTLPALFAAVETMAGPPPAASAAAISCARRSPATRSARASACAWGRSTSARAGTRAPRWACSRPRPAPAPRSGSAQSRRCTRWASPARSRPG